MPRVLHILTRPNDALAREIIARQRAEQRDGIDVVDLTEARPDYGKLLERIFAADSVESW